jgi:anti-sigma regulatory factor (Ser/Thr protein kinase)
VSRFRFTIDSDLADVFLVSLIVHAVCKHLRMDADDASAVDLCAVEAATNAIKHAYRGVRGHEVTVEISSEGERLELEVRDQGMSMPDQHVARLRDGSAVLEFDPADLGNVPEGGMGIEITRQLMDEVSYLSDGITNCLKMTKLLKTRESAKAPA